MDKIFLQYEADLSKLKTQFAQLEEELRGVDSSAKKSAKELETNFNKSSKGVDSVDKGINRLNKSISDAGKTLVAAFAFDRVIQFGKSVVDITAKFQKFEAVLTNTLGSKSAAQKALLMIKDFAASTPFAVEELTASYVKLANQGFKPTAEEMRKLGDLASAMGKGFDQLTEAIIDAQTGEFERLKEFGIRAQKEGDKVSFTFKGVKTQVDFTADSIRKYVLGLGDLEGVSGGMAAISKTLGGQISNLGDSFDALQVALGQRFNSVISDSINSFSGLVEGVTEFLEIPLSEKLEDERIGFNALVSQIISANEGSEKRKDLIDKLNTQYKDYLPNLITEKTTNKELAGILSDVNKQMVNKIIIEQQNEKIAEASNNIAEARIKAAEAERTASIIIQKEAKKRGLELTIQGKSMLEQMELISTFTGIQGDIFVSAREDMKKANEKVSASEKDLADILQEKNDILKILGITEKENYEAKIEETEKEKDNETKLTEYEKLLAAEREKIRKKELEDRIKDQIRWEQLQNEKIAGDIDATLKEADITKVTKEESDKRHKIRVDEMKKAQKDYFDPLVKKGKESEEEITKKTLAEAETRRQIQQFAVDQVRLILDAGISNLQQREDTQTQIELDAVSQRKDNELSALDERLKNNLVSQDIYNRKKQEIEEKAKKEESKIKTKDAQNDKKIALFKIAIDTAAAIVKAVLQSPITFGQPFAGFALATGAVQAALVAAQPIPKFKSGVVRFKGKGTHTSDSNLAMISKDESVIPAKESIQFEDDLRAMHNGFYKKYIQQKYVVPAINKIEKDRSRKEQSMANNMASMVNLMRQNEFYDGNIISAIKKKDSYRMTNTKELAREISKVSMGRTSA